MTPARRRARVQKHDGHARGPVEKDEHEPASLVRQPGADMCGTQGPTGRRQRLGDAPAASR